MSVNLKDLHKGDLVKLSRTARYEGPGRHAPSYRFYDVQSGQVIFENGTDFGEPNTLEVTLLERAKREYKVGDELTGKEVAEGDFEAGTVIVHCTWPDLVYVKGQSVWRDKGGLRTDGFGGGIDHHYRVVHLP